jgi:hypothetical protein
MHVDSGNHHIATCGPDGLPIESDVISEDNFGFYDNFSSNFACTQTSKSTTNLWFQQTYSGKKMNYQSNWIL